MPDYAAIKAELARPEIATATDADIAASWRQSISLRAAFPFRDARNIAQVSANFSWPRIEARAGMAVTLPPVTAGDMAVLAAKNAVATDPNTMIDPNNAGAWAAFVGALGVLEAAGDLTTDEVAAMSALGTVQTTRAAQLGLHDDVHDIEQEIAAARIWPGVAGETV